jgi:hypothetical protein
MSHLTSPRPKLLGPGPFPRSPCAVTPWDFVWERFVTTGGECSTRIR